MYWLETYLKEQLVQIGRDKNCFVQSESQLDSEKARAPHFSSHNLVPRQLPGTNEIKRAHQIFHIPVAMKAFSRKTLPRFLFSLAFQTNNFLSVLVILLFKTKYLCRRKSRFSFSVGFFSF